MLSFSNIFNSKKTVLPREWEHKGKIIRLTPLKKAKNIRLAYNSKNNFFRLTTPVYITKNKIEEFLTDAEDWLNQRNQQVHENVILDHGEVVPILGRACQIQFRKDIKQNVFFKDNLMTISSPKNNHLTMLEDGFKKHALEFFLRKSHEFAEILGVTIQKVVVRDTYSRWGSCGTSGNLSYSWRLIFAPLEIAEYVCAHEVSHRKHMNHSKSFWKTVATLSPNYRQHRAWLKADGKRLFRYKL